MFSIIIPLYNKEKYIAQTLQSVLNQTFQNFEIIIVDDGSIDKSVIEVKKFNDNRIRIVSQQNTGVSSARNRGIGEAKYNLVTFLDADDIWEIDFLETMLKLEKQYPLCSVFALNYKILNHDNSMRSLAINGLPEHFKEGVLSNYFLIASQSDPILWTSSVMVRKDAIQFIGGFPVGIRAGEDLLTWARLAANYEIAYSIEPKSIFNRLEEGIGTSPRIPDEHDIVSEELRKLLKHDDQSRLNGIKDYIAYWHKIRLAIFLRLEKSQEAKAEFQLMAEFAKKDMKFFMYGIVVYSPRWMRNFLNISLLQINSYRKKYLSSNGGK